MSSTGSKIRVILTSLAFISGCAATMPFINRYSSADKVASSGGFEKCYVKSGRFTLTSYSRINCPGAPINVYIEGDGVSWLTRTQISSDPTPREPLVLELAAIDPAENVAYIARPGQYTASGVPDCDASYWSDKRFSEEIINAVNSALDDLKAKGRSREINLIGYSGGAAIAVIVAAKRNDCASLRTIAGNLDPDAVNRYNKVTPLKGSLNPMDFAGNISRISQRHFASAGDRVVPIYITKTFAEKTGDRNGESITIVGGVTHSAGWQKSWPSFLKLPLYKKTD